MSPGDFPNQIIFEVLDNGTGPLGKTKVGLGSSLLRELANDEWSLGFRDIGGRAPLCKGYLLGLFRTRDRASGNHDVTSAPRVLVPVVVDSMREESRHITKTYSGDMSVSFNSELGISALTCSPETTLPE